MYNTEVLPNGLTIIGEYIPHVHSVSIGVLIGAGVSRENLQSSGISHFVEHMLFKGTESKSALQIAETLDEVGGRLNAYTTKEFTMYHTVVLDSHIIRALDLLSDIILNSKYEPKDIEMEKKVVAEEIRMTLDSPDDLIHDIFVQTLWKDHPMGRMILGDKNVIANLKRDDLLKYIEKYYVANNTIISISGNFNFHELLPEIKFRFNKMDRGSLPELYEQPKSSKGIYLTKKDTEQVHLCLGGTGFSYLDNNRFKLSVLNSILGGSMSSRLFQEIREKRGLAYNIYSYYSFYRKTGIFSIYSGTAMKNCRQVVELVLEQLSDIVENGIMPSELSKAKEHLKGNVVLSLENTSSRMSWNAKNFFYLDNFVTVDDIFKHIDEISLEDISALAARIFNKNELQLCAIGPFEDENVFEGLL